MPQNKTLLFDTGDRVTLEFLKTATYNGLHGVVVEYLPKKSRFSVKLSNQKILAFKACNLLPYISLSLEEKTVSDRLEQAIEVSLDVETIWPA